jgi:hypothetical protein
MVVKFKIFVSGSWHHVFRKDVPAVLEECGAIILSVLGASENCCLPFTYCGVS